MEKKIITFALLIFVVTFTVQAYKYNYNFTDTSVAKALVNIHKQHPELKINFIYDELEDYNVNAKIRADNPVDAVRQLVSYNPISVIADSSHIYVEAMQRGKFRYTGRVIDGKGEAVSFASVIFLTAKDSVLITYGVTDDTGKFLIPCDRKNVLAKFSGVGFKTTYYRLNTFNVGDIIMQANTINLKDVTVQGESILMTSDKMVVMVGNNVKKHSYDGYSALSLLMIPGISVDVFNGSVAADNSSVLLCINGMEAERDEIKTLNPKDIIRVEYYNNFDPSHPYSGRVIDFIMKIRDYGGAVVMQDDQNLNRITGGAMADWRMFRKKAEFGVRVKSDFDHFDPKIGEYSEESMKFKSGEVIRDITTLPSSTKSNSISNKITYLQRFEHSVLKTAISLSFDHDKSREHSEVNYLNNPKFDSAVQTDNHNDRSNVSYQLTYNHRLKNKGTFRFNLFGSVTHTDNAREYFANQQFISTTREDYIKLSPRFNLSIPIGKMFSPYIFASHSLDHSKMNYSENGKETPSSLSFNQTIMEAGTNVKATKDMSVTVRFQERITTDDAGYGKHTSSYFTPGISINYKLPRNYQLSNSYYWGVMNPNFSLYTTDEKRIDEYIVRVGNPDLKIQKCFSGELALNRSHKRFRYQVYSYYFKISRAIYSDYTCDDDRGVYVQSFKNGGNYELFDFNVNGNYNIIPDILYFGGAVQYALSKAHTYRSLERHGFPVNLNMKFMYNGFMGEVFCWLLPTNNVNQLGEQIHRDMRLDMNFGYNINGWSFNVYTKNPFIKTHERVISEYPGIMQKKWKYRPRKDYNFIALRISYRFNYGKKHKFENINLQEGGNSAILSH